jgi:hypothetical protein
MFNNNKGRKEVESEVYDELLSTEVLEPDGHKYNNNKK